MNINDGLLKAIKARKQKRTEFGYGILTGDSHVKNMLEVVGMDYCSKFAVTQQSSFAEALTKAANTLVYSNSEMKVHQEKLNLDDIVLPKNTLMTFRHTLTSSKKDRDKDILRSDGAIVDPKMIMLWQHVHTLPIGKMIKVYSQDEKSLQLVSVIVDMNELSHDAAVMVDNEMARFSHGFSALEFEEIKEDNEFSGFDVKKFEIMEESIVSVPSNTDANVEELMLSLVEGGKLCSPIMKQYGEKIREKMPLILPGITIKETESTNGDKKREITCNNFEELKAVSDAGLIGDKQNENGNDKSVGDTEADASASKETDESTIKTKKEETTDENSEVKTEITVNDAMTIVLQKGTVVEHKKMIKLLEAIRKAEKRSHRTKQFNAAK